MLRIAIVGAGGIARRHVEAIATIDFARVAAVVDVDAAKAERMAGQAGAEAYDSLEECVDDVDVVYVLTPPSARRRSCREYAGRRSLGICGRRFAGVQLRAAATLSQGQYDSRCGLEHGSNGIHYVATGNTNVI